MGLKHRGILRIAYLWLGLDDPRLIRSRHFYLEQMGMLESLRENSRSYLRCWHEHNRFDLVLEQREASGLVEIGFQVRDEADLDQFAAHIAAEGIEVHRSAANSTLAGLGDSISFTIPGGQQLRLFAEMEQAGYVTGFESPDWVTPKPLRGTAAPMFLNHVAVTSSDPAATVDFLSKVLQFGISEKIVSDTRAEHEVQLLSALLFRMSREVGGQELAIFPGEDGHLHHIAYTKEDPNDIMVIGTYLREQGVAIDRYGPTRQSYGNTFSIHFADDFNIRLELCAGGRLIDPHPELEPVIWEEKQLGKALSYYSQEPDPSFLQHSL